MFCAKCGQKNPDNSIFCGACGARIVGQQPTQKIATPIIPQNPPQRQQIPQQQPRQMPQQQQLLQRQPIQMQNQQPPARIPVEHKKRRSGNGALIAVVLVLLCVIIVLVGVLLYFLLDRDDNSSDRSEETTVSTTDEDPDDDPLSQEDRSEDAFSQTDEQQISSASNEEASDETTEQTENTTEETTEPEISTEPPYTGPLDPEDFFFIDADSRLLTEDDIVGMDDDQLQLAINEIYARHGYIFNSERMQAYFEAMPWYVGTTPASEFSNDVFNYYELTNINFLYAAIHADDAEETT